MRATNGDGILKLLREREIRFPLNGDRHNAGNEEPVSCVGVLAAMVKKSKQTWDEPFVSLSFLVLSYVLNGCCQVGVS